MDKPITISQTEADAIAESANPTEAIRTLAATKNAISKANQTADDLKQAAAISDALAADTIEADHIQWDNVAPAFFNAHRKATSRQAWAQDDTTREAYALSADTLAVFAAIARGMAHADHPYIKWDDLAHRCHQARGQVLALIPDETA